MAWSNWSGRHVAEPASTVRVASEESIVAVVRDAARTGTTVRALGAGHSHSRVAVTSGHHLHTEALAGVVATDPAVPTATIAAGTRIYELGEPLRRNGLGLINQGDIDRQAIAGAVATGTHGTGSTLPSLSACVVGARVVLASGDVVECSAGSEPELYEVARLGLGSVGVLTQLTLAVREAYRLAEHRWLEDLDDVLERLDTLVEATRHFEFFWYPGKRRAICKAIDETTDAPHYPLGEEGSRRAWSYEVLPNDRPVLHTEMEYAVAAEAGPACLAELRDLIHRGFPDLAWPLEYRTVAADDVWLSMAQGRPTVTISVHEAVENDEEPLFRACEEVFLRHGGRPHWGKVHYLDGRQLAPRYERYHDWWRVRDRYDPDGVFLDAGVARLRP